MKLAVELRIRSLTLYCCLITTLAISPMWNFDPINPVKQLVSTTVAFAIFALLLSQLRRLAISRLELATSILFSLALVVPLVLADTPKITQLWGVFGRNNGLLSYLTLILMLSATYLIASKEFLKKFSDYLVATNLIMIAYCLLQIFQMDFIKWSKFEVFGTLGNVNFLSAFLGMSSIIFFSRLFQVNLQSFTRFMYAFFFLLSVFVIYRAGSLQGLAILLVEVVTFIFFVVCTKYSWKIIIPFLIMMTLIASQAMSGFAGRGPLAGMLFQDTNVYRADYMGAAFRTFLGHPFTGVGFDGFDGWYRAERGFVSAFRTGPNRTSNSAHNIYLDIAANTGIGLLSLYLALIAYATFQTIRFLRKIRATRLLQPNLTVISLTTVLLGYQLQAGISINQIGVGIWGWSLLGAILGIHRKNRSDLEKFDTTQISGKAKKKREASVGKNNRKAHFELAPKYFLVSVVGASVGLALSLPPLIADAKFKDALNNGQQGKLITASQQLGITAFHLSNIHSVAVKSGFAGITEPVLDQLNRDFPRELYGWQARYLDPMSTPELKNRAAKMIEVIDPYFYCNMPNPALATLQSFKGLRLSQQVELLQWWGLKPRNVKVEQEILPGYVDSVSDETLLSKFTEFCGT